MNNISSIVTSFLCNSCGACYGVCPTDAIKFKETFGGYYFPEINKDLCTNCGLCVEVCPGKHFGHTLTSRMPDDPFKGDVKAAYVGKAQDKELYENSQSGGIVSAILAHALDKHEIRAAVVVEMQKGDPPRPVVRLVHDSKELFLSQKSVYCPIPLLTFIKKIENREDKIAIVGLPCHIHGLMNIQDKMPRYKKNIAFTIGLACDRVMTYAGMDYLLKKAVPKGELADMIYFRDKSIAGYPGDVHIHSNKGRDYVLDAKTRMWIKDYFTPARCRICFDKMNVYSDMTVCDPHGLTGIDRTNGESVLIIRSEKGNELAKSSIFDKAIKVRPAEYEEIINGQAVEKKRKQWHGYAEAWKDSGHRMPDYYHKIKTHSLFSEKLSGYEGNLSHSFSLDQLSKKRELSGIADRVLRKKRNKEIMHIPQRIFKKIYQKIKNL